ncbi:ABC transporter ATP-binding protein [Proteiniclasticum ruminis]|uniref:Quaternary amine transport ATP-binding protein n=1 Tax=Proteiniclasticum ruminis TaxID=398199 RepID=A0A1G8K4Z4_9CLOT|nr:ABC transporter ATP-binding protein [Proteiniclasticum ruminis]SDI38504.1 osmoprotectant transport system ATP-binding protein [Proteiniclasticum ruminis]
MIKFENVSKKFKDTKVLKDISFDIEKGQLVVLIGLSGCGKTTTLKMINKLIKPTTGRITIDGEDISRKDPIELRRNIGYVIQQTGLFPHMTIRENTEIIARVEKLDPVKISEKTEELMEMVGLSEEFLDRYPSELSGGQQQRVGVARAFALDPDIILMDEPFSALDPITRTSLQEELVNLQSKVRKTIVFVTHDMSEAIKIADKICIMDKGEIIQYDTPENILKYPVNDFVSEFVGRNRIWESPEYIRAEDIMIHEPVTVSPELTIGKALDKMRTMKVNSLIVVDGPKKRMLGLIKPKQIAKMKDRSTLVKDLMIRDFAFAHAQDSIVDLLRVVDDNSISEIPILSEEGNLMGLVTENSLVTTLSQQYFEEGEVI